MNYTMRNSGMTQFHRSFIVRGTRCCLQLCNPAEPVIRWQLMDRGSGTLSKQMADFVIVCIIRQLGNTRVPAQRRVRKVRSLADYCPSIRLPSVYLHYLSSSSPLLLFSIHLLKNTLFPNVTEQDNLSAFFHLIRVSSTPTRTSSSYLTKFGEIPDNFFN